MPKLLSCAHGHQWTLPANLDTQPGVEQLCPQCGTPANHQVDSGSSVTVDLETRAIAAVAADTAPIQPELQNLVGYDLIEELGRGGMGVVYRAYDLRRSHIVALKTLQRADPKSLHRFKQEFRALTNVTHTNLVTLYELFSDGAVWYFTMELIEGVSFLEYVWSGIAPVDGAAPAASAPRDWTAEQLSRLREGLRQLSTGVVALHSAGILHRDIKPSNVLVDRSGRVVLLDFGLAAEIGPTGSEDESKREVIGTVPYMAPEQATGHASSPSSDWYSVGAVLYEALTGQLPFTGKPLDILMQKASTEPRPPQQIVPNIPSDLNGLCVDLLRRRPEDRPSAGAVLLRLAGAESAERGDKPRPTATYATPLIGRARHLEYLQESFNEMRKGHAVSVLVHGLSGEGKSALIQRFIERMSSRHEAVVLTGRCYERESVPYKALDSLIDGLSEYLLRLKDSDVVGLLPRDMLALAKVFPTLRRVEAVGAATGRGMEIPDQQELRRRAFGALRELLARIADRTPLMLYVDDLQWGDVDSATLLWDLLRPPDSPVLLFLGCYRSDEVETSPFLRRLGELQRERGIGAEQRELEVGPLRHAESVNLVLDLLGREDDEAKEQAEAISRESGGNPFFLFELVKHVQIGAGLTETKGLRLDDVLWTRVLRCSEEARRLLQIVSVAGQPIRVEDAFKAAGVLARGPTVLVQLMTDHLIRSVGANGETEIETYHDRVRESVAAHLAPEVMKDHHNRLAVTLETSGTADPEAVAVHFAGAEQLDKAGKYYTIAAVQAADALAFDRAAKLYARAIELQPPGSGELQTLRNCHADALANAGRGPEAARAYLAAIEGAPEAERTDLRRRAATQYVLSGHMDEGLDELGNVLATVGMKVPKTPVGALVSLLWQRMRLSLRGHKFNERPAEQVAAEELNRIDTCWSVGLSLSVVDPIRGAEFQTRSLLLGLQTGEPYRIARSLAWEAAHVSTGGSAKQRRTMRLLEAADALSQRVPHPHATGMVALANGIAAYLEGRFRLALEFCDRAEAIFREKCTGVAWELDTAHTFALWSLTYLGEIAELSRRRPKLRQEARERGDLYAQTNFSTYIMSLDRLAADSPDEGRKELHEAMRQWTQRGFLVQHHNAVLAETLMDLYTGKGEDAWKRFGTVWPSYRRSLLLRVQQVHVDALQSRARSALAVAAGAADPRPFLQAAQNDARRLQRQKVAWGAALAQLILAAVAATEGDGAVAAARFKTAASQLDDVDMKLFAAVTRRRRGELIGGDEGKGLIAQSTAWMESQNIRNPSRMSDMVIPPASPAS